ncbi:hypothetical protein ABPG72_020586 [Tetrahymena utriculariae]
MDKQNILSQGQEIIEQTKNLLNVNLLNQVSQHKELYIQIDLQDTNISISSEYTLKRKVKSQIVKFFVGQDKLFQNAIGYLVNQQEAQHVILFSQNQENKNFIQLFSNNSNYQNFQSQNLKINNQDKYCSQNKFSKNKYQIYKNKYQIYKKKSTKDLIPNKQIKYFQSKQFQEKTDNNNLKKDGYKQNKQQSLFHTQIIYQKNVTEQEDTEKKKYFTSQQDQYMYDQNKAIQFSDKMQQYSVSKLQNIFEQAVQKSEGRSTPLQPNLFEKSSTQLKQNEYEKILKIKQNQIEGYFSQLKIIFDKIQDDQLHEYTKIKEWDYVNKVKIEWDEQIFEKVNGNGIQKDLLTGFIEHEYQSFDNYIFKIIHRSVQFDKDSQIQIIQILGLESLIINLEQENISILIFQRDDFLSIQKKIEKLVQFVQNIQQFENNSDINSQNCLECTECQNQKTCKKYSCFKNIRSRILAFLQNKQYSYCEYQNKLINGLILKLSKEEFIVDYLNYVHKLIFSFLENDQIDESNTYQQQSIYFCQNRFEENNKQIINIDLINEYSFNHSLVFKKSNQNRDNSKLNPNYGRDLDINTFNDLNKNSVSDNFLQIKIFISNHENFSIIKDIEKNPKVNELNLFLRQIVNSFYAIFILVQCYTFQKIILNMISSNKIDDEGAKFISEDLEKQQSITNLSLILKNNQISDIGMTNISNALKKFTNITDFNIALCENNINNQEATFINNILQKSQKIVKLDFDQNKKLIYFDEIQINLNALEKSSSARQLNLDLDNSKISDQDFQNIVIVLQKFKHIEKLVLNLNQNNICNNGATNIAQALQNIQNLTHLSIDLSKNNVSDEGAQIIGKFLQKNQNFIILNLNLADNSISYKGVEMIAESLPNFKQAIQISLNFEKNSICYIGLKSIASLLKKCQNISRLYMGLNKNMISYEGVSEIAISIQKCQNISLLSLNLSKNIISQEGFQVIIEAKNISNKYIQFDINLSDQLQNQISVQKH